jgi:hypothetical protein
LMFTSKLIGKGFHLGRRPSIADEFETFLSAYGSS